MKKLVLALFILGFVFDLSGQEIEFLGHYSGSDYNKFQNNLGYGIGYYHYTKSSNKLGIVFQHSVFNQEYSDIYPSSEDGVSTYIKDIDPNNQRIAFKLNYAFNLVKHPKSSLFIGPEIGINYFFINEQVTRYENEQLSAVNYHSEYSENNRFSFGFAIEFELKEVIAERISIASSIHPEFIYYEEIGMVGGYSPTFIGWMNFNFGIKYSFE